MAAGVDPIFWVFWPERGGASCAFCNRRPVAVRPPWRRAGRAARPPGGGSSIRRTRGAVASIDRPAYLVTVRSRREEGRRRRQPALRLHRRDTVSPRSNPGTWPRMSEREQNRETEL